MLLIDFQEEPTMTLQVALVGKDGFVIASDTQVSSGGGPVGSRHLMLRTARTEKIFKNEDIIFAISGNAAVVFIARELLHALHQSLGSDVENTLADLLQTESDAILAKEIGLRQSASGQLIVAVPGISKLWEVSFQLGFASVNKFFDKVIGGDRGNSAIFWVERYYSNEKSVEDLAMLAAHTVLEGHFLNPSVVGGLQVLVCKNGETPRFLNDDELQFLCDRSEVIHKSVETSVFDRSKK
jgi:20S proteasome alpha/beta subunit